MHLAILELLIFTKALWSITMIRISLDLLSPVRGLPCFSSKTDSLEINSWGDREDKTIFTFISLK